MVEGYFVRPLMEESSSSSYLKEIKIIRFGSSFREETSWDSGYQEASLQALDHPFSSSINRIMVLAEQCFSASSLF